MKHRIAVMLAMLMCISLLFSSVMPAAMAADLPNMQEGIENNLTAADQAKLEEFFNSSIATDMITQNPVRSKIGSELQAVMDAAEPDAYLPVWILLKSIEPTELTQLVPCDEAILPELEDKTAERERIEEYIQQERSMRWEEYARINQTFLKDALPKRTDLNVIYFSTFTPLIIVELTKSEIMQLADHDMVVMMNYYISQEYRPAIGDEAPISVTPSEPTDQEELINDPIASDVITRDGANGKISSELQAAMDAAEADAYLPVWICLKSIDPAELNQLVLEKTGFDPEIYEDLTLFNELILPELDTDTAIRERIEEYNQQKRSVRWEEYARRNQEFVEEAMPKRDDLNIISCSTFTPTIIVELTKSEIMQLADNDKVDMVNYYVSQEYQAAIGDERAPIAAVDDLDAHMLNATVFCTWDGADPQAVKVSSEKALQNYVSTCHFGECPKTLDLTKYASAFFEENDLIFTYVTTSGSSPAYTIEAAYETDAQIMVSLSKPDEPTSPDMASWILILERAKDAEEKPIMVNFDCVAEAPYTPMPEPDSDAEKQPFRFDDAMDSEVFYFEPVYWAVDMGITKGISDTLFRPENACTRAQVVTFLWRAAGSPEPAAASNPFADVSADSYYSKAVQWAVENGITTGTSENRFNPDATCTRAQTVTFLWRAAGKRVCASDGYDFPDVKPNAYYYAAVQWAVEQGITRGTSAETFSPDATCTRGETVTFLYRSLHVQ